MLENIILFFVSIFLIIKGATLATKYSFKISDSFRISKYIVGFIIVAVISIIPETLISINSAIKGESALGLGTLFGSNVADLSLVFGLIILVAGRGLKIENKILKENKIYPLFLFLPLILGLDGSFSRLEGLILVFVGLIFYYLSFKKEERNNSVPLEIKSDKKATTKNILFLVLSMLILLVGSHFVVQSTLDIAKELNINSIVIGMLVIGLGTTMPELFFSISSVRKDNDSLAIGDILGTVLADATIVVGILALINPFDFPVKIIYSTGLFMVFASFTLFYFMRSGRIISKKEGIFLSLFWLLFATIEIILNI
jgi:cation:H+ antiporter